MVDGLYMVDGLMIGEDQKHRHTQNKVYCGLKICLIHKIILLILQ